MASLNLLGISGRRHRFGMGFYDDMGDASDVAAGAEEAAAGGSSAEWWTDTASFMPPPMTATSIQSGTADASKASVTPASKDPGIFGATLDAFSKVAPAALATAGRFAPMFGVQPPRTAPRVAPAAAAGIGLGTIALVGVGAYFLLGRKGSSGGGTKTNPKGKKGKSKKGKGKRSKGSGKKKGGKKR